MRVTERATCSDHSQSPRESSSVPRFYLPELDSLRFFAFFADFLWHLHPVPGWVISAPHKNAIETLAVAVWQAGEFGVDLFFTLSAFLITELLTREKSRFGGVDIRSFYVRRILRIWPLYYGFLAALYLALAILPGAQVPWRALPGFAVFLGNFVMYRGMFVPLSLGILWSVSLEEQFYLLWPWVVSRLSRRGLLVVAILVWLFSIVSRWRLIGLGVPPRAIWWNSFARLDPLAIGVLLSVWLGGSRLDRFHSARRVVAIVAVLLIVGAGYCSPREDNGAAIRIMLAYPLGALGCGGVVLAALGTGSRPDSWIVTPVLRYLGRISYGLYVFHATMLILTLRLLHGLQHSVAYSGIVTVVALTLTIGVAAASYQWLEKPFLKLKTRFQHVRSMPV